MKLGFAVNQYLKDSSDNNLNEIKDSIKEFLSKRGNVFSNFFLVDDIYGDRPSDIKIKEVTYDKIIFGFHHYQGGFGYDGYRENEELIVNEVDNFDFKKLKEECAKERLEDLKNDLKRENRKTQELKREIEKTQNLLDKLEN